MIVSKHYNILDETETRLDKNKVKKITTNSILLFSILYEFHWLSLLTRAENWCSICTVLKHLNARKISIVWICAVDYVYK